MYIGELEARRRRRRIGPLIVAVADYPAGRPFAYRARVPSFAQMPAGAFLGQDEEVGPEITQPGAIAQWFEGRAAAPLVPSGYRMLPSGAMVPLDALGALGAPRRRRRRGGFGEFLRRGGIIGWIGRQPVVRKVLPRPITAAMRLEFEKIPGAALKQFLEPVKPLGGIFGAKKRRRPPEEAAQLVDTPSLLTPEPASPGSPARGESMPGHFAPPSYAPAAQMWGDVPPDMPGPEEMMAPEMPGIEEYSREALIPGAAEYEYPAPPGALMPERERAAGWVEIPEAGLAPGPGAELVEAEAVGPAEELQMQPEPLQRTEAMMGLGQQSDVVYWWQPTPPYLGAAPEWFRTTARVITAAAPAVVAAFQPPPADYFTPPTAPAALMPMALPPAPRPAAPGMPIWLWPVLGLGLLGTVWVMMPPASRRR